MPTDPALIQLLLSEFQTQNLGSLSSAAMNDRYEAFVWLLAIRAAREEGATVSLQTAGAKRLLHQSFDLPPASYLPLISISHMPS